jgi:hypothetical protein
MRKPESSKAALHAQLSVALATDRAPVSIRRSALFA